MSEAPELDSSLAVMSAEWQKIRGEVISLDEQRKKKNQKPSRICNACGGKLEEREITEQWGGFFPAAIEEVPREREWIVQGMIPRCEVTLLTGRPKTAKSYLLQQLLTSSALGIDWIGRPTAQVPSLGLFLEDDQPELSRRQCQICVGYGIHPFLLGSQLELNPREWLQTKLICFPRGSDDPHWTPFGDLFWQRVESDGYQNIVVDTATRALGWPARWGGDKASNVVTLIRRKLADLNAAMIVTDHTNRSDPAGFAGCNTWLGSVRAAMNLRLPDADQFTNERRRDKRVLSDLGGNYGSFDPIRLKWEDSIIVLDDEPAENPPQNAAVARILADPSARWLVMAFCDALPEGITMMRARSGKCWYRNCDGPEAEQLIMRLSEAKIRGNAKKIDE